MQEFSVDKKWKYLQFIRDDSPDGWSLNFSDEPSGISRDRLLSAGQIDVAIKADHTFFLVFNAMASDSQLIECSDGLHQAFELVNRSSRGCWKIFPTLFNRNMWRRLSSYLRYRSKHHTPVIESLKFAWMSKWQLELTLTLMTESLGITDELAILTIEQLIEDKEEE
ncbi:MULTISPECIES: hypothetical protein [unclassified Microcoleus]|uniref:hypothetical protein n=1 Tax=unclassified Microcoleus TaxID=2642155 RepID=UPI001DA7213E|nr:MULTISPECIES: hypothetical protein [unclassified Microcoleus]MCC3564492.1 hypothetical protein [Microcoleus sp. PH2017_31_RDM_U_A]MCC3577947.1 hypothetical protein [Microcoleus sp. PH2017_32_RDM_D_A]MCC3615638.1 hypothetical protein [Microcoleus sp. PH2017_38_RDM_U_B]